MKRVLILSAAYYPKPVGGAESAIKEITDRIAPGEIEFHMVTLRYDRALPRVEQVGNVLVHRIGITRNTPSATDLKRFPLHINKHLFQLFAAWKGHRLHARYHYDGLWVMMAHSSGIPGALFRQWHSDVAYIQTLQEGDPPEHIERMMRPVWPLFKRAFTTPTIIQVISTFLGDWARRQGASCPIAVVPNGVNTERFARSCATEELNSVRAQLCMQPGETWLITTSRLVPKNGVDDVLRALPDLPRTVKFAILGVGADETMLRSLARELGVDDRVVFAGQVEHVDMPKYLKACDIFIRPSRSEGMGNSFIEAMAAGLPVIATQEGGISDFLYDAVRNPDKPTTGWAVDRDSPQDIVRAVRTILADRSVVERVLATARAMVRECYDWSIVAERMKHEVFDYALTK